MKSATRIDDMRVAMDHDRVKAKLEFDSAHHEFRLDGSRVPSVTQALRGAGVYSTWTADPYYLELGTAAHRATELDDENDLDEDALDELLIPYLEGWREFRKVSGFVPAVIEYHCCDPVYRYAGIIDRVGLLNGKAALIDIKTGTPSAWAALQTAGYARTLPFHVDRFVVQLPSDGGYRLHSYEDRNDAGVFLACLAVANWKSRKEMDNAEKRG